MAHLSMDSLDYCIRDADDDKGTLMGDAGKFTRKKNGKEIECTFTNNRVIVDRMMALSGSKKFFKFVAALMDAIDDSVIKDDNDSIITVEGTKQFYKQHYTNLAALVLKNSKKLKESDDL